MNKEPTTEQIEAIEILLSDLNELENKPRRLFYALENIAIAFDKKDAIPSLREAQDMTTKHMNEGDYYQQLFRSLRDFTIEEWRWQVKHSPEDISDTESRIKGAEEFVKFFIKELTVRRFY